jgi:predicted PolB exonuclease-like 3'-5' exonuclease
VPKFTASERMLIQNLVCNLSIKRIPDNEIIKEVYEHTKKTISKVTLFNIRKRIKKESSKSYTQLRQG